MRLYLHLEPYGSLYSSVWQFRTWLGRRPIPDYMSVNTSGVKHFHEMLSALECPHRVAHHVIASMEELVEYMPLVVVFIGGESQTLRAIQLRARRWHATVHAFTTQAAQYKDL